MNWFTKRSARVKLLASFAAVSIILGGVAGYALRQMGAIDDELNSLATTNLSGIELAYEAQVNVLLVGREVRAFVLATDATEEARRRENVEKAGAKFLESCKKLTTVLVRNEDKALCTEMMEVYPAYIGGVREAMDLAAHQKDKEAMEAINKARQMGTKLDAGLMKLVTTNNELAAKAVEQSGINYHRARLMVLSAIGIGLTLSITLGWIIARWFTKALLEVAAIADAVASASQELAAASETLASGAQEQASSLEETASSLEEITGTIQQNADNAQQANQLAGNSREVAEKGGDVVSKAVHGMNEINASSKRIADIITTIDEIAFQTNLLALNAAVEAARAGEQGRGFAVVAGEVRNLAQRSAGAAKEIKSLIQDSVGKVDTGTHLVNQSGQTLADIVTSVKRVTDIVSEIAAASREQAGGIEQVNKAVTQMDQVTQANASQTEELSSTAEALAGQAAQLQHVVSRFNLSRKKSQPAMTTARAVQASVTSRPAAATKPRRSASPAPRKAATLEQSVEHELDMIGAATGKAAGFEEF